MRAGAEVGVSCSTRILGASFCPPQVSSLRRRLVQYFEDVRQCVRYYGDSIVIAKNLNQILSLNSLVRRDFLV